MNLHLLIQRAGRARAALLAGVIVFSSLGNVRSEDARLTFERFKAKSYQVHDLGVADLSLPKVGSHQMMVRGFLNNRGEALIGNRLWLPQPAYGRPAGWTDFGVQAMGLSDRGTVLLLTNGLASTWKDGVIEPVRTDIPVPSPLYFIPWDISRDGKIILGLVRQPVSIPGNPGITSGYRPSVLVDGKFRVLKSRGDGRYLPNTVITVLGGALISGLPLAVNGRGHIVGADFGATPADDRYVMWDASSETVRVLGGPVLIPESNSLENAMHGSINSADQIVFGVLGYSTQPAKRDLKMYLPSGVAQNPLFTGASVPTTFKTIPAGWSSLSVVGPGTGAGPVDYVEVAGINDRGQIAAATLSSGNFNILGSGVVRYLGDAYDDILGFLASSVGPLFRPRAINDAGEVLTVGGPETGAPFSGRVSILAPALAAMSSARIETTPTGRELAFTVTVTNVGRSTLSGVTVDNLNVTTGGNLGLSPKPIATDVPTLELQPGGSLTARWRYGIRTPGAVILTWRALGMDAGSGARVDTLTRNHRFELKEEPQLGLTIALEPAEVSVGERFSVLWTAINYSAQPISNIHLAEAVAFSGDGGVELLGAAPPSSIPQLEPGGSALIFSTYTAKKPGRGAFTSKIQGELNAQPILSAAVTSPQILIKPTGDLEIRPHAEKPQAFLGAGVFEKVPAFQTVKRGVETNEPAVFDVKVVNPDTKARQFSLKANPVARPGWEFQCRLEGVDVTALVQGETGLKLPEIPAGGSVVVEARMTPDGTVPPKDETEALFTLLGENATADTASDAMDAVLIRGVVFPIEVKLTYHRILPQAVTPESLQAGQQDIHAPLEPVPYGVVLVGQPRIGEKEFKIGTYFGWVADGVTPLLVRMTANRSDLALFPEGRKFRVDIDVITGGIFAAGGSFDGPEPKDTMRLLDGGVGSWARTKEFVLDYEHWDAFLWLSALEADQIRIQGNLVDARPHQFLGAITVAVAANGREAQDYGRFGIRKPPIFLLHGYNTAGDWGYAYRKFASRAGDSENPDPDSFIRTIKYGQLPKGRLPAKGVLYPNTTLSLEECARGAAVAMAAEKNLLLQNWAFTRVDVIAHSQGGVLARMLANQNANAGIGQAYRNPDNFNRGRFHRVVTIGAPHNGSRLLSYTAALVKKLRADTTRLPSALGVLQPLLQEKFNPFGTEIRMINDPDPASPWYPDPGAPFHLVRTAIDLGRAPAPGDILPAYQALGLTAPGAGAAVLPRGSDGVVDFDSMGAQGPGAAAGANVFDLEGRDIAHAPPLSLFRAFEFQTESALAARHAAEALEQDPRSGQNVQFGPFQLPVRLPESERELIDAWAAKVALASSEAARIQAVPPQRPFSGLSAAGTDYSFAISYQAANAPGPQENISWWVEVHGPLGITSEGVTATPHGNNQREVTLTVTNGLVGDVVLQAAYVDSANRIVLTDPVVVTARPPANAVLTGFEMVPGDAAWPLGTRVEAHVLAMYSDGTATLRFVQPGEITVRSSQPEVVSVADPLRWDTLAAGSARVVTAWSGFSATNEITVTGGETLPALAVARGAPGMMILSWPASAAGFQLEQLSDATWRGPWKPVAGNPAATGGVLSLPVPAGDRATYFRLRQSSR